MIRENLNTPRYVQSHRPAWVEILEPDRGGWNPALSFISCMTVGSLFILSASVSSSLKYEGILYLVGFFFLE